MPRLMHDDREFRTQEAAYLCGERGLSQLQAGERMGLSQSYVSRLLALAQKRGWLVRTFEFVPEKLPADRLAVLRRLDEPKTLEGLLSGMTSDNGVRVRVLRVVGSPSKVATDQALRRRFTQFGREAASVVAKLLPRSSWMAVTWGRTVSAVVDGMPEGPLAKGERLKVRFVPVCGEPAEQASNRDTSSHLAERLHRRVGTDAEGPPSLTGVQALIPMRFRGKDAKVVRRFVQESASYAEIFGSAQAAPLIGRVDTLLTSIGPAKRPMGFVHEELLRAASVGARKLTRADLAGLVAGDVGGVLIPRRDANASIRRQVAQLNEMWTGIRREHLERIAREANAKDRPGVIVVSIGGDGRAEIIAEAVRCGLVNVLIIDPELAAALARVLAGS